MPINPLKHFMNDATEAKVGSLHKDFLRKKSNKKVGTKTVPT